MKQKKYMMKMEEWFKKGWISNRQFHPVILSSHCFYRTINPPMCIHSILYTFFVGNLNFLFLSL